ncbi:MAG: HEPN domain-containing protein [Firmicutes bacterium]|nr:HEPN domain-containing protein [Bacillota bacterium]
MPDSELRDLANARLQNAKDCLVQANALLDVGQYKGVANRAYFAIFHAMRAVLALDKFDTKKHSGMIAKFRDWSWRKAGRNAACPRMCFSQPLFKGCKINFFNKLT